MLGFNCNDERSDEEFVSLDEETRGGEEVHLPRAGKRRKATGNGRSEAVREDCFSTADAERRRPLKMVWLRPGPSSWVEPQQLYPPAQQQLRSLAARSAACGLGGRRDERDLEQPCEDRDSRTGWRGRSQRFTRARTTPEESPSGTRRLEGFFGGVPRNTPSPRERFRAGGVGVLRRIRSSGGAGREDALPM